MAAFESVGVASGSDSSVDPWSGRALVEGADVICQRCCRVGERLDVVFGVDGPSLTLRGRAPAWTRWLVDSLMLVSSDRSWLRNVYSSIG